MKYESAVDYLFSLQLHTIKLGLDAMNSFLKKVGNPHKALKVVHVAGTNGKGSVCQGVMSAFQQAGYKVGVFTSPHLYDVRERFKINDRYISKEDFTRQIERIQQVLGDERITYFECTTAVAFLWFAEQKPDLVLLETGMGGRLDATNVVEPLISIITNVSMDHEAYLGNTIQQIAGEKGGIIKPGVPVISGCKDEAAKVIKEICLQKGSTLYQLGKEIAVHRNDDKSWDYIGKINSAEINMKKLRCSLEGEHQAENMALAITAAKMLQSKGWQIDDTHIINGLVNLQWPGRLESFSLMREFDDGRRECRYLLDGAHNPAGIASLITTLKSSSKNTPVTLVYAAMGDKDRLNTLPKLALYAERVIITRPDSERAAHPQELFDQLDDTVKALCEVCDDLDQALQIAECNCSKDHLIVVAGSLYLVGEVRYKLLGNLVEN